MSPVFVGSDSNDSKIRSNRIGFAASTTDPGSFSAGEAYYNSTDSQLKVNDGSAWNAVQGSGSFEAVASGTLSDGSTVMINTDGTVGIVTVSADLIGGVQRIFNNASTAWIGSTYDSTNGKVIIGYRDGGNSNYGTAIVGTVSGTSISFGPPAVFESASVNNLAMVYDSTNQRVVIGYKDAGNNDYGTAVVGTVSLGNPSAFPNNGRTWSNASQSNFNSSTFSNAFNGNTSNNNYAETTSASAIGSITFDPPLPRSSITSFLVNAVSNGNNSQDWGFNGGTLTSRVCNGATSIYDFLPSSGDISSMEVRLTSGSGVAVVNAIEINGVTLVNGANGPTVTFGTPVVFASHAVGTVSAAYDPTNSKVLFGYNEANVAGYAIVGTVSGTSISFGSAVTFDSSDITDIQISYYDDSNTRMVVTYRDASNSNYGTALLGQISGTSISFGPECVFNAGDTFYTKSAYDSTNGKILIVFSDNADGSHGKAVVGTPLGTSINFGTESMFSDGNPATYITPVYDSDGKQFVISYLNGGTNSGEIINATISGTSVSFGSSITYGSGGAVYYNPSVYDSSNQKVVTTYMRAADSFGISIVISPTSTNLTASNFIGFSDGAYTNGQTAKVQIVSSIDDAQVGLTTGSQYYVQNDGSLSSSAGSPSVFAGTALSDTQISVKL